jgi:transposase-like protein
LSHRVEKPLLDMVGVASTLQTFHLGCAIMTNENEETYTWVLRQVEGVCDYRPGTIVTDRELGLLNAIVNVFPDAHHMLCEWHVITNVAAMAGRKTAQTVPILKRFTWQSRRLIRYTLI